MAALEPLTQISQGGRRSNDFSIIAGVLDAVRGRDRFSLGGEGKVCMEEDGAEQKREESKTTKHIDDHECQKAHHVIVG